MTEMEDGIYQIVVSSSVASVEGFVVMIANSLNGGGDGYVFRGRFAVEEERISGPFTL